MNLKMLKMAVAGIALSMSSFANAGLVLLADLSVANTITISATSETSLSTVSGTDLTGFFLSDFFDAAFNINLGATLISGNLTSASNASDNTPVLWNLDTGTGVNVWSFTDEITMAFTAGELAFSGQASWIVSAAAYASVLNGAQGGNVYAPLDNIASLPNATLIGTWAVVGATDVPEPSTLAILGLGLMGLASRRFKKQS